MRLGHCSSNGHRQKRLKHTSGKSHPQLFFFFPGKASKVNIYIHIKRFSEHHLSLTAKIWPPKKATRQFVVCLSWRALFTRLQVFTSQEAA